MDLVADIKQRLSIEDLVGQYVTLRKSGRNYKALCPFHSEKTPSFYISLEKQIAFCFGCQKGGDVFQFYQEAEGVDFPTALKALAEKAGVDYAKYRTATQQNAVTQDEKQQYYEVHDFAVAYFKQNLWEHEDGKKVLEYLRSRGLTDDTIREWNLGFSFDYNDEFYRAAMQQRIDKTLLIKSGLVISKDMDGEQVYDRFRMRLMFPIQDAQGRTVAFGGRALKKGMEPKYLNSPETVAYHKSDILFALAAAKPAIRLSKRVIMVEGYMDTLACHQAGIKDVVATSGTAMTTEHSKILKRLTDSFYLCFDNDNAGWEATKRAFLVLQAVEGSVRVVTIPSGKDPADCLMTSKEEFLQAITDAKPFFEVYLERTISMETLTPERIAAVLAESLEYIRIIQNKILQDIAIRALAGKLGVKEVVVYDELKRLAQHSSQRPHVRVMQDQQREAISNSTNSKLHRVKPEELIFVCALNAPDKAPLIFEKLHESDFPEDLQPAFVRMRDLLMEGKVLSIPTIIEGLDPKLSSRMEYFAVYGEALYSELPLEIFEKDVQTALDKVVQNRKNVQLEALKRIIKNYQQEGKKIELADALEQLREKLNEKPNEKLKS